MRAWRHWRSAAVVLITVALFLHLFALGRQFEMDTKHFSFRYLGQGQVMGAIDVLLPGTPYDHRFNVQLIPVAFKYWNDQRAPSLAAVLNEAGQVITPANQTERGWVLDDKGYVDLLAVGFRMFGVHRSSVYYVYFVVLGATLAVYLAWAGARPQRAALAPLYLLALITIMPVLIIDDQLSGLHEQRFFAAMGFIPLAHVLLAMWDAQPPRAWTVLTVTFQALALAFVYHCRNDSVWQLMAVVACVPLFLLVRVRVAGRRGAAGVVWPAALVCLAFVGLTVFQQRTYAKEYYEQGYASHAYWHNMIMGLSYDPVIAKKYDLAVDDRKVIALAARTLKLANIQAGVDMFNNDFNAYQAGVRTAFFQIVSSHPFRSAGAFLWYKPMAMGRELLYAMGLNAHPAAEGSGGHGIVSEGVRRAGGLYFNPIRWFDLAVLALTLAVVGTRPAGWRELFMVAALAWLFSSLVPLTAVPMLYLMGAWLVMVSLLVHATLLVGASSLWNAWRARVAGSGPAAAAAVNAL